MANEVAHTEIHEDDKIEAIEEANHAGHPSNANAEAQVEVESEKKEARETVTTPRRQQEGGVARRTFRQGGRGRRFRPRRKVCSFCVDKVTEINYKDVNTLRRFLDGHAKIIPRRKTGTCAKHQRRLAVAVKQARHLALLPFTARRSPVGWR